MSSLADYRKELEHRLNIDTPGTSISAHSSHAATSSSHAAPSSFPRLAKLRKQLERKLKIKKKVKPSQSQPIPTYSNPSTSTTPPSYPASSSSPHNSFNPGFTSYPAPSASRKRKDNHYTPSPLRPDVLAPYRVSHWTTPHAAEWRNSLSFVTLADKIKLFETCILSIEESTRSNYAVALLRFTQWCDERNIPEHLRMPASEELISLFIASWAGRVQPSTINSIKPSTEHTL
ncbi:hypothetical protein BKA70DRAFT_1443527 [Coprinopsis sp. MPI-PUGE-AT-0042]|nr:hypothetical protein BKA70DRAFT_1443527 [Coprinopsis sp. MPI-PUGE-AT-0042]